MHWAVSASIVKLCYFGRSTTADITSVGSSWALSLTTVTLAASTAALSGFCPPCSAVSAGCTGVSAASVVIESQVPNLFHMFRPSMIGESSTMASADF